MSKNFKRLVAYMLDMFLVTAIVFALTNIKQINFQLNDHNKISKQYSEVVKKYDKPFFFAEAGCKSTKGSLNVPNDWTLAGEPAADEQAKWYDTMFKACDRRDFVEGFFLWDWSIKLYPSGNALSDKGYNIYAKPAEEVVRNFYRSK